MTRVRFDSDTFVGDDVLLCPACGGNNLHQDQVDVWQRPIEDGQQMHSIVGECMTTVGIGGAGNPSNRRDGLTIQFSCEHCPADPVLAIWQHKGNTYMEWKR